MVLQRSESKGANVSVDSDERGLTQRVLKPLTNRGDGSASFTPAADGMELQTRRMLRIKLSCYSQVDGPVRSGKSRNARLRGRTSLECARQLLSLMSFL